MVKKYILRCVGRFITERRPCLGVNWDGIIEARFERSAKGWEFVSYNFLKGFAEFPPVTKACLNKLWADGGEVLLVVGPDPFEYTKQREEEGVTLSAAVKELACICSVSERSVWRWMDGSDVPPYAAKLLSIWADCTPEQRDTWFNH